MAPIYEKEMVFEVAGLKSVSGRLSVKTPKIVTQSTIEGWPYVILTEVPGIAIKFGLDKLQTPDQLQILKSMAQTIQEIASCPAQAS